MADTTSQRILAFALGGKLPRDIANLVGTDVGTVLSALADLTVNGDTRQRRALRFLAAGVNPPDVALWLGVSIPQVQAWAADLSTSPPGPPGLAILG